MSVPEARRVLRRIELEAYASIVSAFRAEGHLTLEKKAALTKLCQLLSISSDRHHAEVRRAICDDQLCYIADCVTGCESKRSWLPEGKRTGGRGNPRLVARHALSSNLQGQALAAVTASTIKTNVKSEGTGGGDESEKKLPPQVQSAIRMITSQHQSSASAPRPPKAPPPPSVSLKSTGSQTNDIPRSEVRDKGSATSVQTASVGTQVEVSSIEKVDIGTQFDGIDHSETVEGMDEDLAQEMDRSKSGVDHDEGAAGDADRVSDESEMIGSHQQSSTDADTEIKTESKEGDLLDFDDKEINQSSDAVSNNESPDQLALSSSFVDQKSDISETALSADSDTDHQLDTVIKEEPNDIKESVEPDPQPVPGTSDYPVKESHSVKQEEKVVPMEDSISSINTSSSSINTSSSSITTSIPSITISIPSITTPSTISSSTTSSSSISTVSNAKPSSKRRPLKRPASTLTSTADDVKLPSTKLLRIDNTLDTDLNTENTSISTAASTSTAKSTITAISTSTPASTSTLASTVTGATPVSISTPVSTSTAVSTVPVAVLEESIVSIPVSSIPNLPILKRTPPQPLSSSVLSSTSTTVHVPVLYSTAMAALISPSPLSPISPSPLSPSPISSCPLSPSPVPESPPTSHTVSINVSNDNPTIHHPPPTTAAATTTQDIVNKGITDNITHLPSSVDTATIKSEDIKDTTTTATAPAAVCETESLLKQSVVETSSSSLIEKSEPLQLECHEEVKVKREIEEEGINVEDEKMEVEESGNIFNFSNVPRPKRVLPLNLFHSVPSSSSFPRRRGSSLILSSANPNSITSVPSIEELSSSISSPGGENLFFPETGGPRSSHASTPSSPFPSSAIPDENILLEAVTNELGVDSIDPSLLNMSDLLSLLQPDSDPLDQLALTTEESSSDMVVLQQSDELNIGQDLDLNINEEELLEGLPQELRDTVQAMLDKQ